MQQFFFLLCFITILSSCSQDKSIYKNFNKIMEDKEELREEQSKKIKIQELEESSEEQNKRVENLEEKVQQADKDQ